MILNLIKNRHKVLGFNSRFLNYIRPSNKSKNIKIADNKVLTKRVLSKNKIPVPKKIAIIKNLKKLESFDFESLPKSFVLKPVNGSKGGGVEIFYNRDKNGNWIKAGGKRATIDEIKASCRDIIDGRYSLFNQPDVVLIEERVKPHKQFRYYTYRGTPDVRIIVYNHIPVMAMIRIPTKESEGKANLDKGAIGCGIDLAAGRTTFSIVGEGIPIETVPGSNLPLSGLEIPYWDQIMENAVKTSVATGLGYVGIDFLLDEEKGPLIVEINARSGLKIQLANKAGLDERLKKIKDLKLKSVSQSIRISQDLFGGEIAEEVKQLTGKVLIGRIERARIYNVDYALNGIPKTKFKRKDIDEKKTLLAKIDTGAYRTSVDEEVMRDLGYGDAIDYFKSFNYPTFSTFKDAKDASDERGRLIDEGKIAEHELIKSRVIVKSGSGMTLRPVIKAKIKLADKIIDTNVTVIDRSELNYKMIIGRRDLKNFIVDPYKALNLKEVKK